MISGNISIASGGANRNLEATTGLKSVLNSEFTHQQKNINVDDDHLIMQKIMKNAHYTGNLAVRID